MTTNAVIERNDLESESEETTLVANWIGKHAKAGVLPHEFGVFVRSAAQLDRASAAVKESGIAFKILDEHVETAHGYVSISTMHLAKGLEFRAVVVMACDDGIIPDASPVPSRYVGQQARPERRLGPRAARHRTAGHHRPGLRRGDHRLLARRG